MEPKGTLSNAYNSAIGALGAAAVAYSLYRVVLDGVSYQWVILAYLTVLTGSFTIAIPGVNSKFSVSDTFIFVNTLLFGTAAGVLTGALDGLVGSLRSRTIAQRKRYLAFNTGVLGLSVFAAGQVMFKMLGRGPLIGGGSVTLTRLGLPVLVSALVYYLCNSVMVAGMLAVHSGKGILGLWRTGMAKTLGITLAGAAAGGLVAFSVRSITPVTLLIVVPVLVSIYFLNTVSLGSGAKGKAAGGGGTVPVAERPAYRRFHYFMVAVGLGFLVLLVQEVLQGEVNHHWMIGAALAVIAGFVTVRVPGVKIKFSLADTFVFANIILFGPVVGGITAALDGLAGSMQCKTKARRVEFTLFNIAGMALSAYMAGALFFQILGHGPAGLSGTAISGEIFLPSLVLAISYYFLNTMAVGVIVALQAHASVVRIWCENLLWGLTTCVACALGAVFVSAGLVAITPAIAIAVALILTTIYITFRTSVNRLALNQHSLR